MDEVARELKCRQRVLSIYNKSREDFDTKEAWDDYLEVIEDIVYNLSSNIDVQQTEARILDYERSNRANIIANQARKAEAERVTRTGASAPATATSSQPDNPQGFVPTSLVSTALSRQPVPTQAVAQDADGSLQRNPNMRRYAMGSTQEQEQAVAAGWSPDMPRLRAMQEAFGSMLVQL